MLPAVQRPARERVWHAMRIHDGPWTILDLVAETEAKHGFVRSFTRRLVNAGLVRRTNPEKGTTTALYQLINNIGPLPPVFKNDGTTFNPNPTPGVRHRKGPIQDVWTQARKLKTFDMDDLQSALPGETVNALRNCVKRLENGFYVSKEAGPVDAPARVGRWRLVLDVGAQAPTFPRRAPKGAAHA